jgi:hypothetical protein
MLVGGTVASALGIGYGFHLANTTSPARAIQVAQAQPALQSRGPELTLTDITFTAAAPDIAVRPIDPVARPVAPRKMLVAGPDRGVTGGDDTPRADCESQFTATAAPDAMVRLALSDPCLAGRNVTFHHNGMMFSHQVGPSGSATVTAPALAERAIYIVSFGDGNGAVAQAHVPDLPTHQRVVLQWQGDDGLQLHAFEDGAAYGEPGHLWAGSGDRAAPRNDGGTFHHFGDGTGPDGLRADVYTFPGGNADVVINIEAEVTGANCGHEVSAQVLQLASGDALKSHDLSMAMPGCDAKGDFLVLKNLDRDLNIARN